MTRRLAAALLLASLAVSVHAGDAPTVHLDWPEAETTAWPYPLAVLHGRVERARALGLTVSAGGRTVSFEAPLGEVTVVARPGTDGASVPLEESIAGLTQRMTRIRVPGVRVSAIAPSEALVRFPIAEDSDLALVSRSLAARATDLRFRIEVLPREHYRVYEGSVPPRLAGDRSSWPWPGSAEEFEEFKRREVARCIAARDGGTEYVPSDARYRVVPKEQERSDDPTSFAVLEESDSHPFDGRLVQNARASEDARIRTPVVLFDVAEEHQAALRDWTARNLGLPLAIVLNGRYRTAPRINAPLESIVQITLGNGAYEDLQREAQELAVTLGSGPAGAHAKPWVSVETTAAGRFVVVLDPTGATEAAVASTAVAADGRRSEPSSRRWTAASGPGRDAGTSALAFVALAKWGRTAAHDVRAPHGEAARPALVSVASQSTFASDRLALAEWAAERADGDELLLDALEDPDPRVRRTAAVAVAKRPAAAAETVPLLLDAAKTASEEDRRAIVESLRSLAPRARAVLRAAATDDSVEVRRAAVEALADGAARDDDVLRTMIAATRDPDDRVRLHAAIGVVGTLDLTPLPPLPPEQAVAPPRASPLREESLDAVANLVRTDPVNRDAVAMLLAMYEQGRKVLIELLAHGGADVRTAALLALSTESDAARLEADAIRALLTDPSLDVRLRAADVLLRITGDFGGSRRVFEEALRDRALGSDTRGGVLLLLSDDLREDESVAAFVRDYLDDPEPRVREGAALSLWAAGRDDDRARALVERILSDPAHPFHENAEAVRGSRRRGT